MKGLKQKMYDNRISAWGLARETGISHTTIYSCIDGKRDISASKLYKIMQYFNDYDFRNYL